jgi:hypothetical protein
MELSSQDTRSTILEADDAPDPVFVRCEAVTQYLLRGFTESPETSKKAKFFATKIVAEALLELRDAPPEMIAEHFLRSAAAFYWVSTGNTIENMPMPDGFWDEMGMIPDKVIPVAIESRE